MKEVKTLGMLSTLANWAIAKPSISNALRLGVAMRGYQEDQSDKSENRNTDIDWKYQNELRKQWLEDNPNARYEGWMSI